MTCQVSNGQKPSYIYEFTSSQFDRNADSELIVKDGSLDRDAPSQPMLIVQVRVWAEQKDIKLV